MLFDLLVSMNKWSLICSSFLGTINLLHFTPLFVFTSSRYHIIFLVILPSHFSSMEQMLMLMVMMLRSSQVRPLLKGKIWTLNKNDNVSLLNSQSRGTDFNLLQHCTLFAWG